MNKKNDLIEGLFIPLLSINIYLLYNQIMIILKTTLLHIYVKNMVVHYEYKIFLFHKRMVVKPWVSILPKECNNLL